MIQVALCVIMIFSVLVASYLWSAFPMRLFHMKDLSFFVRVLIGFFFYMCIFQLVHIVAVLIVQMSLSLLTYSWLLIVIILTVASLILEKNLKQIYKGFISEFQQLLQIPAFVCMVIVVLLVAVFSVLYTYQGWDTAYYVSIMSDALKSDYLYRHEPADGVVLSRIPLKQALCGFFTHFTIMCKLFHVDARIMTMYGIRGLCVILSCIIIFCFGRILFDKDSRKASYLTIIWLVFQFYALSIYSSASFLFIRGYEAKGYCANVVLPMVLLCIFAMLKDWDKDKYWKVLGIVSWASVPLSMSALVTVPAAVGVFGIVEMIRTRSFKNIFFKCLLCVLPNLIYLVVYFLWAKGLIVVEVRLCMMQ